MSVKEPVEGCTHIVTRRDRAAGYSACMFCIETGECNGKGGICRPHQVVWDRWEEEETARRNNPEGW